MEDRALFLPDGDFFVGTISIQGGWHPDQANGGAVLGLLGHCLEDVPSLVPMTVSRFTADLMRPVPIGRRLRVESSVLREGKKIQVVELHLLADDVVHVRATALRLRDADLTGPDMPKSTTDARPGVGLPRPEQLPPIEGGDGDRPGFLGAIDIRRAPRTDDAVYGSWVRLKAPVVAGEPVRPTARMALAFDFVNMVGVDEHPLGVTMINPDLSAHVLREPTGEWVAITGDTRFNPAMGRGLSSAILSDDDGAFAVVSLSQILQRR